MWEQLCKGPEVGLFLAEASSWNWEEGAKEGEVTTRFGRVTDILKPVSPFLLWNLRPRKVRTSRWQVWLVPGKLFVEIAYVHI